ncbi:MAG: efflux RND transporter permease subunit, partial [Candidatus Omnitrophica bacterium]|nr:efflux RND transporter permease subunit [Candidatus Omnitrophota bacterium]
VLVFIPVLTLSGLAGRLFAPLGIAYILAVMASLIVALTVTPALSLLLLGRQDLRQYEPPVVRWSKAVYAKILPRVARHPGWAAGGVLLLLGIGLASLPFLHGEFLPKLQEGDFIVHMSAMPGTSLEESLRLGRQVTRTLFTIPSVRVVSQKTGRANEGSSTRGTHQSEIDASLGPEKGRPARFSPAEVRKVLASFPGLSFSIKTFLSERIEETLSGYTASVVVNLFGSDLAVLDRKGREISRLLKGIPGSADVKLQSVSGTPQMMIRLRKDDLNLWGFDPLEVLDAVHAAYQGSVVGQVYERNQVFDVAVLLAPNDRKSVAAIGNVPVRSADGVYVRLQDLADIYQTSGRYDILHDGTRRVQAVTCDVTGRDMDSFIAEAKKAIGERVSLPAGTYVEFTGTAEAAARSRQDLLVHSLLAGLGIVILLFIRVRNYRNVLLLLLNLPFALTGGILATFITGGVLSLGSLVGFVTVFGITLRTSIMLFSHNEHLVSVEGLAWGPETAWRAASERLAPILMTALVTAFGLLPLALGSHAAGREIEGPMAVVILGGLVTSTAINLLVLPPLTVRYGWFGRPDSDEDAAEVDQPMSP